MARLRGWIFLLTLMLPNVGWAQFTSEYLGGEKSLLAETKQVNQFFRRFNGEELPSGARMYPGRDSLYRDPHLREEYLAVLFDESNPSINSEWRRSFTNEVIYGDSARFLDFYGPDWFAEVNTTFSFYGREYDMILFLKLERAEVGVKWVISHVYFEPFQDLFQSPVKEIRPAFIHPLSHELDFMNLIKVFRNKEYLELYAEKTYKPDFLSLFLYESKRKNLEFRRVKKVKFHFFQVDGWYFELSEFNRPGMNRGWLISQISQIPEGQKEVLLNFIYTR
ncbi:hypothetical protein [Pontibacter sp. G13]|uniref:hypothetical protein n=1 Tax=Pontibacter sp. G13 TaxID=3074898 RepID=UPI00288B1DEF|nr:hypothetical protein [Pontibacter sp. G13]WNJ19669.1 hypothetical protein RJD25_04230 [Pontibacter sp. G13]